MSKGKKNKETKFSYEKSKKFLIISIVVSFISFIGIGITALPVENTTSNNTVNNVVNEIINENVATNEVKEENITTNETTTSQTTQTKVTLSSIPKYNGKPYVTINNNVPYFNESDLTTKSYEKYSNLDSLGRCGVAVACIGKDIMPTDERESIGSVKPTGWHTVKYKGIDGNYLYNRCHLIGFQLTGENANKKNLITGTRYLNVEGMLPFENMVDDYIEETNNHVMYRVTPMFDGKNLLASGVLIEAKSVEDNGAGIQFNVYCYNVQPNIEINYSNGESKGPEYTGTTTTTTTSKPSTSNSNKDTSGTVYVTPTGKRYHLDPDCGGKNSKATTLNQAKSSGKTPCQKCAK